MVQLLAELEQRLELDQPLRAYLAGGMAVHLYTGQRVTADVDIEFAGRILVPNDLSIDLESNGKPVSIHIDVCYNPMFSLLHEHYQHDAVPVALPLNYIDVRVLSPVDLAVSKIARFADNDKEDIAALVRQGLTNASDIAIRGKEALTGYVARVDMVRFNLLDAVALAASIESEKAACSRFHAPGDT
jgi:hypothetical protein